MKKEQQKTSPKGNVRLVLLAVLMLAAGWMMWRHISPLSAPVPSPTPSPVPMQSADERQLREKAYEEDLAALEKLLASGAADEATQAQAAQRMERMIADHQSELALEEALQQAGFSPVLVLMQNGALTVIVSTPSIQQEHSASILNLCTAHTDLPAENIRIMPSAP